MKKEFKKTILLDLDGVLNQYCGNFNEDFIPPMKPRAEEFLRTLSREYRVVVFTTRNRLLAVKWLVENELDGFVSDVSNVKSPAYLHVDDRAICHRGDFEKTLADIENFSVHWQN